jgi:hypothetical protein
MRMILRRRSSPLVFVVTLLVLLPRVALAQLSGFNIKGDQGLKAGTQAPAGIYFGAPLHWYTGDEIRDQNGRSIDKGELGLFLGGPLVNVVTPYKVAGANYGFMVALPIANARIEAPRLDENPSAGISDMYVQPVNLGWHLAKADVTTGYGFYAPTGRYTPGADNNTGLGMWGHELFAGTTVFFDDQKSWHAATFGALEFHSNKKDSDVHVGTLLTLEGGVGRDFLKGAVSTGLAYYAQWKVSDDTLTGLPSVLVQGRNRVAGLGPDVTLPIATKSTLYGFVSLRYQWEVGARTTTEGSSFTMLVVMPLRPIKVNP